MASVTASPGLLGKPREPVRNGKLSDGTHITFQGFSGLTAANFP